MGKLYSKIVFFFLLVFIISCSKNNSGGIGSQNIVLNGCDSIKKNLITLNYKDSIRLSSCFILSHFDSLYLFPSNFVNKISTFAGNGAEISSGDGGQAIISSLFRPRYLIVDRRNGDILIQDQGAGIRKITSTGIITTVVKYGTNLGGAIGFTFDSVGNYYFTIQDVVNGSAIKKVSPTGVITKIAGDGYNFAYGGDGSSALNISLNLPDLILVDNSNNIIFYERGRGVLRKINSSGIISTINSTVIYYGTDLKYDTKTGDLYLSTTTSNPSETYQIWRIASDGTTTRIAGGRLNSYENGAKAIDTRIFCDAMILDDNGNIYFSDVQHHQIYKIFKSGIMYRIAGTGEKGFSGDGGNALSAILNWPFGIAIDKNGDLLFSDMMNNRIRKITLVK